jgi:hypothetical protein
MAAGMDLEDVDRQKFRPAFQVMMRRVRDSLGMAPPAGKSATPAAPTPAAAVAAETPAAPVATTPAEAAADPSQKVPFVDWNDPV